MRGCKLDDTAWKWRLRHIRDMATVNSINWTVYSPIKAMYLYTVISQKSLALLTAWHTAGGSPTSRVVCKTHF